MYQSTHHYKDFGPLGEFLRRYPHDLNGRNVDLVQVVEIIAGLLPVWRRGEGENAQD